MHELPDMVYMPYRTRGRRYSGNQAECARKETRGAPLNKTMTYLADEICPETRGEERWEPEVRRAARLGVVRLERGDPAGDLVRLASAARSCGVTRSSNRCARQESTSVRILTAFSNPPTKRTASDIPKTGSRSACKSETSARSRCSSKSR